jgi:predicted ATP-dependent endonuclease of OLD family
VKRLLPRLNTHHKQFFFSSAPVFVEGYTDQQLFSLIQERRGRLRHWSKITLPKCVCSV